MTQVEAFNIISNIIQKVQADWPTHCKMQEALKVISQGLVSNGRMPQSGKKIKKEG